MHWLRTGVATLTTYFVVLLGATLASDTPSVRDYFLREIKARGISSVNQIPDGRFEFEHNGMKLQISLENVERQAVRDGNLDGVKALIERIFHRAADPDTWSIARPGLRFSAEPSDHEFGDTVRDAVSDRVSRVLVWTEPNESGVRWVTEADLKKWGISRTQATSCAAENMSALLNETKIEVTDVKGAKLGVLSTHSPFKASLIFSPNAREVLGARLGWPLLAVIPCRDFAFVFAKHDDAIVPYLGKTVVDEFTGSGYPISPEVFEISDKGVKAIGEFPVAQKPGDKK